MIDRDLHLARALLVESNALLRSVASAQLRDLGVGHVSQASRIKDARLLLEREHFDIVLCNLEFEGSKLSGQDLLDELQRENQLPLSTVFLMVTSSPRYAQVVEAAEAALDGIIVRPYTTTVLADRLREARRRKHELNDLLRALDAGEQELALAHALKRFTEQQPYWLYCGRLAAELLLSLRRPQDAQKLFTVILKTKPAATWAKLGIARTQMAMGDSATARKTVAQVLVTEAEMADAHDLMGRLLVEQSDFDGALAAYRASADLTPGCLLRAQHAGSLAFYQGHRDEALACLERTLGMGVQSKLFDALSLLLIALLRFDQADAPGVLSMGEQLQRYRAANSESVRLRRFDEAAQVLVVLLSATPEGALTGLRTLTAEAGTDDFDLIAASMVLALWARLPASLVARQHLHAEHETTLQRITLRFCTSKALGEVLSASAGRTPQAIAAVRASQVQVAAAAEAALEQAMNGDPAGAIQALLATGEATRNNKLLDMTGLIAKRYQAAVPQALEMSERAALVARRSGQAVSHIAGMHRSGRSPGSLKLQGRGQKTAESSDKNNDKTNNNANPQESSADAAA